jgi:hypothetical protein
VKIKAGIRAAREQLAFMRDSRRIQRLHRQQTLETVAALKRKYEGPVSGPVRAWDLMEQLAHCIDPTDSSLGCASQQVHVLQVLDAMEADGVDDPDMKVAALVHDIGKLLLLDGEDPENVVCMNDPIGEYAPGIGLDRCVFQWNHDEFAYSRLAGNVPDHVAWLIRYHSVDAARCEPLMDERDRDYARRYLVPFQGYDQGSKSAFRPPRKTIAAYRELVEQAFPKPILF